MSVYKTKIQHKNKNIKKLIAVLLSIIVIFVILYVLNVFNFINPKKDKQKILDKVQTTSTASTAQENFTKGGTRIPVETPKNEGTLADNNGSVSTIPPESQWTTSKDKATVVYFPGINNTLKNGSLVTGRTTNSSISFRLIDNVQGIIAQGNIKVVNGLYSGTLNFTTKGKIGRLDIFSTNSDGVEKSNIEIEVRY